MKVNAHRDIPARPVEMEGSSGCTVRWLVDQADGAPTFAMRQFEVSAGGYTPKHHHPYEHEVYVLEGEGVVMEGDQQHPIRSGDVVYVAPDEVHQFLNTSDKPLRFLCMVPNSAGTPNQAVQPECGTPETPRPTQS